MELTESKGIVMTTIALDEREVKEIAALPPEAVAQRVKEYLGRYFGVEMIKDIVVCYESDSNLTAALRL